jgi:quercetin dioxygenase-like cupin family protein
MARAIPRARVAIAGIGLTLSLIWPWASVAEVIKPLFQQALPDSAGKTMTVVTVTLAPTTRAAPHRHGQAFLYAYVLKGRVASQLEGQPARIYKTGEGWFEPPGSHHVLTENPSARNLAELLVVFVADTGAPLKTDDPEVGPK